MIEYRNDYKEAYFQGLKYTRDNKTGYYLNSTHRKRLHCAVWEANNGKIPEGGHIHHRNVDKGNNDPENLICLEGLTHRKKHGDSNAANKEWKEWARNNLAIKARPKASEWHGSEKGREWHKEHYNLVKDRLHLKIQKTCDQCQIGFEGRLRDRFCSNKCKSAWRRKEGLDNEERRCEHCGSTYIANKYSKQRVCSRACANSFRANKKNYVCG